MINLGLRHLHYNVRHAVVSTMIDIIREKISHMNVDRRGINEWRTSSYVFTHIPGDESSEKALAEVRKQVKGSGLYVKLQGRKPIVPQKQFGYNWFVPLSNASRMDVYVYVR